MEVMGIRYCDFTNVPNVVPFNEVNFSPVMNVYVRCENGSFAYIPAEILVTQDPDKRHYLIKNPEPKFSQANHYMVICNYISIAAFPKPQMAREWAKNIGNDQYQ